MTGTVMAYNNSTTFLSATKYNIILHFIMHRGGTHESNLNLKLKPKFKGERKEREGKKGHI